MNAREEKRRVKNAKIRYFLSAVVIYIGVYLICVLIMEMLQMALPMNPYVKLGLLILFFFISSALTRRLIRFRGIMNWIRP